MASQIPPAAAADSPVQHGRDLPFGAAEALRVLRGDIERDVERRRRPPPARRACRRPPRDSGRMASGPASPASPTCRVPPSGKATGEAITPPLANGTFSAVPNSPATLLPSTEVIGASAASSACDDSASASERSTSASERALERRIGEGAGQVACESAPNRLASLRSSRNWSVLALYRDPPPVDHLAHLITLRCPEMPPSAPSDRNASSPATRDKPERAPQRRIELARRHRPEIAGRKAQSAEASGHRRVPGKGLRRPPFGLSPGRAQRVCPLPGRTR